MRKLVHERTLAFFQASDDPLEDYFELLRDTMLRNAKDRQEKEALFESISYAIKERYFKQKTLTELAHMLNKPREYVRMMTDKRLSFMIRTHLIDFQMILQLIEEAKGTEEEAGDEAGDEA